MGSAKPSVRDFRARLKDERGEEWVIKGIRDWNGYELTVRQSAAVMRMGVAGDWICEGGRLQDGVQVLREELAVFLREAGLKPPAYKPPESLLPSHKLTWFEPESILWTAYHANRAVRTWEKNLSTGKPSVAAVSAFEVATFVSHFFFLASQYAVERHWGHEIGRQRGAEANKRKTIEQQAEWLRIALDVRRRNPNLKSISQIARHVARRAGVNPTTGEPYHWRTIYNHIKKPLRRKFAYP